MSAARRIHRSSTRVMSVLMIGLGIALVVETITGSGSVISARLLLGALFVAAGVARLYLELQREGRRAPPDGQA